jgi:hypothetical protein
LAAPPSLPGQDSLGGNSKALMVACVSPAAAHAPETVATLRFARDVRAIQNRPTINRDTSGDAALLRAEVERLRR